MKKYLLSFIALISILNFSFTEYASAAKPEEDFGWDYKNGWFDKNPGKFSAPKEIYDNDLNTKKNSGVNGSFEVRFFEPLKSGILGFYANCDGNYTSYTMYNGNKAVYTSGACGRYVSAKITEPIDRIKFQTNRNYSQFYVAEFDIFDEVSYQTVKNLKVSEKTFNGINIEWANPTGSIGTRIYLDNALVATLGKDDKSYKIDGLKANKKYEIGVSSLYKEGESINNDITAITDKVPDLPNDFVNVSDISATSAVFNLNVDKLPSLPERITIYRTKDGKDSFDVPVYSNHPIPQKIYGLKNETEYIYYVQVNYGKGNVTNMIPVNFKTIEPSREVTNLNAKATAQEVSLEWKMPVYKNLDVARIYREKKDVGMFARMFKSESAYEPIFETNGTTFKDLTVKADTEYKYKVTTVDTDGKETDGKTVTVKTQQMRVSGGGTDKDENGNYVITWTSPTTGKIKVLVGGKEYAIVPATDKKIVIPKDKMKFDLIGLPDVQLIPISEDGEEGVPSKPGGGNGGLGDLVGGEELGEIISPENIIKGGVGLLALIGGFLLLGLAFRVVPKLIRTIRTAFSAKSENIHTKRRIEE